MESAAESGRRSKVDDLFRIAVVLLLSAVLSRAAEIGTHGIEYGPQNVAVVMGEPVTLRCRSDGVPNAVVRWYEYVTSGNAELISDGDQILPGHPNRNRYTLIRTDSVTYDLKIDPTILDDGGFYKCVDSNAAPPSTTERGAQLVVLASEPVCTTTLPSDGFTLEGEYFTAECRVEFQASQGIAPRMTWTGPGSYQSAYTLSNKTAWSGVQFYSNRTDDAQTFECVTNFTENGFDGPDRDNTPPSWSYLYQGNQIWVYWPPKNMYAEPLLGSYEIGMTVTCYADAWPNPTYAWHNMRTQQIWLSQMFTITEDMVGFQTMRCRAQNVIRTLTYSEDYFLDVYVNARTTPGTPSTTLSTPAAVANCPDLTGRWEAVDPKASMCITVDHDNDARLIGLFRNGSDTYWLQIAGRTREGKYDESGWTIIWPPKTIGVSSYAAECYSCTGVDTLLANAVSRATNSTEFCGTDGNVLYSPTYTFHRVPTTYPCTSSAETMLRNMDALTGSTPA